MKDKIRIGALRFRLDLTSKSMVSQGNLASKFNANWNKVFTRSGDIVPVSGAQYLTDRNVEDRITHKIFIRYEEQLEDRGRISHIRHTHTRKYGQFYYITDENIDDTQETFSIAGLTISNGEEYAVEFEEMTNTNGDYFIRDNGSDVYSLHASANDAINNVNRINLVKTGSAPSRMKIKKVLQQRGILYEVMRVSTIMQRKRFLQFDCIELGNQSTYNVV